MTMQRQLETTIITITEIAITAGPAGQHAADVALATGCAITVVVADGEGRSY